MKQQERAMPKVLRDLHKLEFDYADGEGIDFETYSDFMPEDETKYWIRTWTGNKNLDGNEYLIFGQDGTGGYAAFWFVRTDRPLLEQPIVFFGSEGELGVVASHFSDYLWLLAGGIGPYEAVAYPGLERESNPVFTSFAKNHATSSFRSPWEVVASAQREFPEFTNQIQALCS